MQHTGVALLVIDNVHLQRAGWYVTHFPPFFWCVALNNVIEKALLFSTKAFVRIFSKYVSQCSYHVLIYRLLQPFASNGVGQALAVHETCPQ
jgi:hypothetical protein